MTTAKKVLKRGMLILVAPVALIPLAPVIALMYLVKWLHGDEEPQFESHIGDSGIAVRYRRRAHAPLVARASVTNSYAQTPSFPVTIASAR